MVSGGKKYNRMHIHQKSKNDLETVQNCDRRVVGLLICGAVTLKYAPAHVLDTRVRRSLRYFPQLFVTSSG